MDYKKLQELSKIELLGQRTELERQLREMLLNSSLTNLEKPHMKKSLKVSIARINSILAKGDK